MNGDSYNPNDPLFLVSESIDDTLSPVKQRALQDHLANSDQLQREAAQLERVAKMIARFAVRKPTLNWEAHAEKILSRIAERCSDESLDEVDRALTTWANRDKNVSVSDMSVAVLERAHANHLADAGGDGLDRRGDRDQIFRIPWLVKLALPLAAAAAIVLAALPSVWNQPSIDQVCVVQIGPQHKASTSNNKIKPRSQVRFVRVASVLNEPRPTDKIGLLSIGAG